MVTLEEQWLHCHERLMSPLQMVSKYLNVGYDQYFSLPHLLRVPNLLGDSFFSPAFSAIRETI
jgi:hypothetical protein